MNIKRHLDKFFPGTMLRTRNYLKKGYEPEMDLLKYFCSKTSASIDIGANYGVYSYMLAAMSKIVYSFEPVPVLYGNLKRAFRNIENVKIYNFGLSNSENKGILHSPVSTHGWSTLENNKELFKELSESDKVVDLEVNLRTLDSFKFEDVSFIKIDVEGHEYNVLEGAVNSIRNSRPVLLIEIEEKHRKNAVRDVTQLVKSIDSYNAYFYHNSKLFDLDSTGLAEYQNVHNTYIFNFLFIHKDSPSIKKLHEDNII